MTKDTKLIDPDQIEMQQAFDLTQGRCRQIGVIAVSVGTNQEQPSGGKRGAIAQSVRTRAAPPFALLFAIVSTASAALSGRMGGSGLLATSALSGVFEVDVAVLRTLRLVGQSIMAGTVVLGALSTNAGGRLALALAAGPIRFWAPLAAATVAAIGLGFATFALLPPQ